MQERAVFRSATLADTTSESGWARSSPVEAAAREPKRKWRRVHAPCVPQS
jgi:hypothetical protein